MKTKRQVGIWMDHCHAYLIEISLHGIVADIVEPVNASKSKSLNRQEALEQQTAYYTKLKDVIKHYDEVLLFGPNTAKDELSDLLKKDVHFHKIKIEIKEADKMSGIEQQAFVMAYFRTEF